MVCAVTDSKLNMMTFNPNNNKQNNIEFTYVSSLPIKYMYQKLYV
jgi:hypothetical protein